MKRGRILRSDYRDRIRNEYLKRRKANPQYSVRAFARSLSIAAQSLSPVLEKKRHFKKGNLLKVAQMLGWSQKQVDSALASILTQNLETRTPPEHRYYQVKESELQILSEWYYLPVYYLSFVQSNEATARWVSGKLGISESEAKSALDFLLEHGLIGVRAGRLHPVKGPLSIIQNPPGKRVARYFTDVHKTAEEAYQCMPQEEQLCRISYVQMARSDIEKLRTRANNFVTRFTDERRGKAGCDEIYTVLIRAYPTKVIDKKKP